MVAIEQLVQRTVLDCLDAPERDYLVDVFQRFGGYPSLQNLWQLMDAQWQAHGCDPARIDERVSEFYRHPVWLLNGLFIEQDAESAAHRRGFARWVGQQNPTRVADFGGGFGGLARRIGEWLPKTQVEIIEPHPHPAAQVLAQATSNVRYVSELSGRYDVMVATDVFEHVSDPIGLARETAEHLPVGGKYLMANCFWPVIKCHLPHLFHLQVGWDAAMWAMGLSPQEKVQYGRVFVRRGRLDENAARHSEAIAGRVYPWLKTLPRGRTWIGNRIVRFWSGP